MYNYSKDYEKLFNLVNKGAVVPCLVNFKWNENKLSRDMAGAKKIGKDIMICVRGICYSGIIDDKIDFIENCKELNLEYIQPYETDVIEVNVKKEFNKFVKKNFMSTRNCQKMKDFKKTGVYQITKKAFRDGAKWIESKKK